jgi:hypothetical protein
MNRREFLRKSLEGIVIGIPLISSCGKNPVKSEAIKELDIVDFTMEQNRTYLLTSENDVYEMSGLSETTLIKKNDIETYYKYKLKELLTDIISDRMKSRHYSHICSSDSVCYGIILAGWSSRFLVVDPVTGEEKFLRYMQGEPAGLLISGEKLWYISNRLSDKNTSLLRSYNKYSGGDIDFFNTPLRNIAGLSNNDKNFITYEKISNSFVKFKIENNEFKLLEN